MLGREGGASAWDPDPRTGPEPRWVSVRTAAILQSGAFSTHVVACTWSSTQLAADTRVDAEC